MYAGVMQCSDMPLSEQQELYDIGWSVLCMKIHTTNKLNPVSVGTVLGLVDL